MSTRCQVTVIETDTSEEIADRVTLYHHSDGYPEWMVPLFQRAVDISMRPSFFGYDAGWKACRAGHAAGFLCAADPDGFEPEAGHELHSDIEWYYRIWVNARSAHKGSLAEVPNWQVECLQPGTGRDFWNEPSEDKLTVTHERQGLQALLVRFPRKTRKFDPEILAWNNGTIGKLAKSINAERRWGDLPILADALEEAGYKFDFALRWLRIERPNEHSFDVLDSILHASDASEQMPPAKKSARRKATT